MALPNEVAPPKPPFVIKGRWRGVSRDGGIGRCHGAAPEQRASVSAGRCEIGGREAAGAPRTRSEAESAGAEHRASVSAGRCEIGGREAAGAPRTRSEAESAGAEHRASVSAGRCEDKQSENPARKPRVYQRSACQRPSGYRPLAVRRLSASRTMGRSSR